MPPLQGAIFMALFASAAAIKVLNVNWKCTDGAPCLNIVRPRGAFAVVSADEDSYKLVISVHRPELARERMLKKWTASAGTTWNVEVAWFRLVEKGVRLSMQHCRYQLVCVVPLLADEAMARSDETLFDTGLVSHHFLVAVKYEGHKAVSEQEIIIEREASGSYEEYKPSNQLQRPSSASNQDPAKPEKIYKSMVPHPKIAHPDLQEFIDEKKQKATNTLINSGLYSGSNEINLIPSLYPVKDAPEDSIAGNSLPSNVEPNMQISNNIDPSADQDGIVVIEQNNRTSGVSEKIKGFLSDIFIRLGPTATVIILLLLSILMAVLCTCGANRVIKRFHSKGTREYVKLKQNNRNNDGEQIKKSVKEKKKPPTPRDTSWFWSKYKGRNKKGTTPTVSTGIQERFATYSKVVGKFLKSARGGDDDEYQPLVEDDDEDANFSDDNNYGGLAQKLKKTSSKIFEKIQSNENIRNFKTRVRDNPFLNGGQNAAQNMAEGKDAMGETSIFGLKIVFKRLLGCLATLLSPFIYICRYICDCCCGWCFGNPISRLEKTRDAKVRSFMPSRGPLASSSSSDEDSSSDEVNVFIKEERKPKKFVTFALDGDVKAEILDKKSANEETVDVISVDQKEISPKTDISGRFTSSQPVKILRDSGHGASDFNQQKVLYPSCRSPQLNSQEIASNAVYTSSTTERPGCTIRATQSNAADSISKISTCKSTSHQPPYTQERSLPCLHPNSSNADRKHRPVRAASKSLERPSLPPHLNSRISRTPPPIETPRSSSSAEAIAPSRIHRVSVSSCSSNSSDNSKSSSIGQQRGNTSNSDMSALERTKEYFRQEKQQMNDLLRVWEARTRPRKMIVDVRGRSRSREWLSHQRNRRRELCLQQEERFSTTSRARANGTAHTLSTDSHNIPLPRAASQGSVTVGNRLEMPRMQEPSQWCRSKTSTARSPMPSAKIQSQPPSSEDQDTKPQNIQQKIIQSAAQRLSHAIGSYSMESDGSDVSISSLPPSSSGLSNDGKTSVSISLSTSNTSIDQKEYLNQTNNDKEHNIPSADKPTTSNCVTISNSKCSLRTREQDDSHAVTSRNSPNPCSLSPPVSPKLMLSVVENSMWKKLESTESHQGKEATHRPTYPLTISKNDSITSPILKRKQSVEDAESNPSGFNILNKLDKTTSEPGMNLSKHCYVSTRATAVSTNSKCSNDEASFCNGIDRSILLPSNSSGNSKVPSKSPIPKHSNIFKLTSHGVDLAVKPVMADSRTRPSESTIIEIPECLISDVSRAPATNSSYCFPQENFENENRKPVSFNPFKKWKKHRKGGIALKNSLKPYDKNCTERDCSLSMENECAASIQAKKRDNEEGNLKKKVNKPVMVPKICLYDEKAKSRKFDQRSNDKACKSSPSGKGHHGIHVPTCKPNISPKKTTKRYTVGLKSLAKDPAKDVICPSGFRVENNHIRNRVRSGKSARRKSSSSTTPQARRVGNTEPTFHGIPQCNDLLKMKSSGNIENSSVSSTTNNSQRRYSSSCTVASDAKAQSKQNQGSPLTYETQSSPPQSPLSVVIPPLSFSETSSSNGGNEYLSVPTSPNEQQFLSEMDDFSRNNIPPVGSPRYYTLYPSIYKKQPPDRPQQSLTPRTALDTAVSAFLHEGDYESFSSSDDNDDFWRVSL